MVRTVGYGLARTLTASSSRGNGEALALSASVLSSVIREAAKRAPVTVRVRGRCMRPSLVDGQTVRIASRPLSFYFPGDVVGFLDDQGRFVLHRVISYRYREGCRRLMLVTKADRGGIDPPVPVRDVMGCVVGTHGNVDWRVRVRSFVHGLRHAAASARSALGRP